MKRAWIDNLEGITHEEDVPDAPTLPLDALPTPTLDERVAAIEATVDALTGGV